MLANGPIFGDEIKSMSIIVEYMQANCKTRRFRSFVGGQVTTQGLGMIYRLKVTYERDPKMKIGFGYFPIVQKAAWLLMA